MSTTLFARQFVSREAIVQRLVTNYQLLEQDETEEGLALPTKLTRPDQARECIENMEDYLIQKRVKLVVHLYILFVYYEHSLCLPMILTSGVGHPSFAEEMIARAPHMGPDYKNDNRLVWDLVRYVAHGGPAWDWVTAYARTFHGRNAFLAMKTHYLGPTFQALIRAHADWQLNAQ
jgi:hypothetical protein